MRALLYKNNSISLAEIAIPRRGGEALVRVTMAGICNTDLEIMRGYANFSGIMGHEFVGMVEESPDASMVGRRVVGEINVGCGTCPACRQHDARHCLNRNTLGIRNRDGAFAEFLALPTQNLRVLPDTVTDRQAVFTEPLAAACEILDQVEIEKDHRVAVIGDGKLGQLIARVLATTGCRLTLIGKHEPKLALAAAAGIQTILLRNLTSDPASRFDRVVEATGSSGGLELALDLVRSRGTIILKSTFHGDISLNTSRIVVDEISLVGSRCGRFEPAIDLLARRQVDVVALITSEYPLADGVAAMAEAARPGVLKVILRN